LVLSIDPESKGHIECPNCKYGNDVKAFPDAPAPPERLQKPLQPDGSGDKTVVPPTPPAGRTLIPGMLVWVEGDHECVPKIITLKNGRNVIGRGIPGSECSVRLESADNFISRKHACIELVKKSDDTFEHHLSDLGSRNGTFHNGE
jgi:hypothetical protein